MGIDRVDEYQDVGPQPKHAPSVGDLTFEVGFLITAVVYLGWHAIARTGRESVVSAIYWRLMISS